MILYGWNNYLLKTVHLEELGISSNKQPDISIEYRQKYFHLFFIPFFPLGKFWAVRKDGQLYQPSPELHSSLQSIKVDTKNWLWAWTGFFLIIGGFFIYNIGSKMEDVRYAKVAAANTSVLTNYFKNEKNNSAQAGKIHAINFLIDSSVNEEGYEHKKIDTSLKSLVQLYLKIRLTHTDTLTGYNQQNTFVYKYFDHKSEKPHIVNDDIKKALEDGNWQGYSDTSSVFSDLRKLNNYKYLLVLKEYNRAEPEMHDANFSSGISLVNASIINIENKQIEKKFKIMAANSDSVSHFTYRKRNEYDNTSSYEWKSILNNDLNNNVTLQACKYVFGEERTHTEISALLPISK